MASDRIEIELSAASAVGQALKEAGEAVAIVEATTGGLITASLQSRPKASRFVAGSMVIYTHAAAKALLPREMLHKFGTPQNNYSSPSKYRKSKIVFTTEMANYAAKAFGADWAIAESGAATTSGLGPALRDGGAFTALTVIGPGGFTMSKIVESAAPQDRVANMAAYSQAAVEFLGAAVMREHRPSKL